MRYFLSLAFLFVIYSCAPKQNTNKEIPLVLKEYLTPLLDSFNTRNLYLESSLQFDISLDTINIDGNKRHTGINIIFPNLAKEEYPEVYKQVAKLIKEEKQEFYETVADEKVEFDSGFQLYRGWGMWIEPKSLYKTEKVISFGIESGYGYTGMPSGFEYHAINYDLENKKQIAFNDYFLLTTKADTTYLEGIISRAMNRDFNIKSRTDFLGQINFSFDDLYVYFYLDKYDVLGWGITSIKRKYILDHINPAYR
jgi:hypothetical protein